MSHVTKLNTFKVADNRFINLYSKDNPILESGDTCFFLFNNVLDIHRPLIGKGYIREDFYTDSLNKTYYIELIEVNESQHTIDKFLTKPVVLNTFKDKVITKSQKVFTLTKSLPEDFYKTNLFRIEAFFVRSTFDQIVELRKEFVEVIKKDLLKQIEEIDQI